MARKSNSCPYRVVDTFNQTIISQHRTLDAAVKSEIRFRRACREANNGSCVPTSVELYGKELDGDELDCYLSMLAG
jgi:succinate dehydrogenase/fumarate reductase-like Fe-S protein